jgi:hypothetical protein
MMFFFEKKEPKNFCYRPHRVTHSAPPVRGTSSKSFLLLFFKKEGLNLRHYLASNPAK